MLITLSRLRAVFLHSGQLLRTSQHDSRTLNVYGNTSTICYFLKIYLKQDSFDTNDSGFTICRLSKQMGYPVGGELPH
jgi:hypothetical protein